MGFDCRSNAEGSAFRRDIGKVFVAHRRKLVQSRAAHYLVAAEIGRAGCFKHPTYEDGFEPLSGTTQIGDLGARWIG